VRTHNLADQTLARNIVEASFRGRDEVSTESN
jgi:hypothetical protein